ncbi:MAG: hypothetical protein HW373_1445 [Deltaproteobacteria bacterium]|nr:hypothetical protein [Deltaproteobacteria bacterium]
MVGHRGLEPRTYGLRVEATPKFLPPKLKNRKRFFLGHRTARRKPNGAEPSPEGPCRPIAVTGEPQEHKNPVEAGVCSRSSVGPPYFTGYLRL